MRHVFAVLLFILIAAPSWGADFHPIFINTILPHEGGFSMKRNDPGNWTGGVVGKGKLKGTNMGIAANTFPNGINGKAIKDLTPADVEPVYEQKYFGALKYLKSQGIADELCDEEVNHGKGRAGANGASMLLKRTFNTLEWIEHKKGNKSFKVPVQPDMNSKETMEWINGYTADVEHRVLLFDKVRLYRIGFYTTLAIKKPQQFDDFYKGWIARTLERYER